MQKKLGGSKTPDCLAGERKFLPHARPRSYELYFPPRSQIILSVSMESTKQNVKQKREKKNNNENKKKVEQAKQNELDKETRMKKADLGREETKLERRIMG